MPVPIVDNAESSVVVTCRWKFFGVVSILLPFSHVSVIARFRIEETGDLGET